MSRYEKSYADLHDKPTGLYLYGDLYVADEFMREKGEEVRYGVDCMILPPFTKACMLWQMWRVG